MATGHADAVSEQSRWAKLPACPFALWAIVGGLYSGAWFILPDITLFKPVFAWNGLPVLLPGAIWAGWLAWCLIINGQKFRTAENVSKLVTTGPYAVVRHPIYLADVAAMFYLLLVRPELWVAAGAVLGAGLVVCWAKKEEAVLRLKFGRQYDEYARKTAGFNPLASMRRNRRLSTGAS